MLWQLLEFRVPMRIDRPVDFERAANPLKKFLLPLFDCRLRGVMNADQSHAFLHQLAQLLQMILLQRWMSAAAIHVEHNRSRAIEGIRILRPAVAIDDRTDARNLVQAGFQQQATGAMLVLSWPMAGTPGDKHNLLVSRGTA